jgi:hypothetical protein
MKLEYLADGSRDCPLIRIYEFTAAEAAQLRAAIAALADGKAERVDVQLLPFVEPVSGCRLTLFRCSWDQAVVRRSEPAEFACGLTPETWDNMAGLLEPFTECASGFQWLAGAPGETALLLSVSGEW